MWYSHLRVYPCHLKEVASQCPPPHPPPHTHTQWICMHVWYLGLCPSPGHDNLSTDAWGVFIPCAVVIHGSVHSACVCSIDHLMQTSSHAPSFSECKPRCPRWLEWWRTTSARWWSEERSSMTWRKSLVSGGINWGQEGGGDHYQYRISRMKKFCEFSRFWAAIPTNFLVCDYYQLKQDYISECSCIFLCCYTMHSW